MSKKFAMAFSGGKDSVLALYRMINRGYEPVALLTTAKKNEDKSWTHGLNKDLLKQVSESLNIPVFIVECDVYEYEIRFEEYLKIIKNMGAEICAFGDIDIEEHRQWDTNRCENVGLKAEFPLWQENREKLVYEFIDSGFTTIIKAVNLNYLSKDFLGKQLTKDLVKDIKSTGADACGENGEYHTFVVNGPIFKYPIDFKIIDNVIENGYGHLHIR